jgi:hypothetical protein
LIKLLTYVQILDTWTHHHNLSGYLPMNMNKFKKKIGSFIEGCFLLRGHNWSYRYHWVRWIIIVIIHVILNMNWFMVVFDRLWSGRAVTEHKYVFLWFFVFFFGCVYMYLCMSPIISIIVLNCLPLGGP